MNIQAQNDFIYLGYTYAQPYFMLEYFPISSLDFTPVNCFMYSSKNLFENGQTYLLSFGSGVSNEIVYDENLVADEVIKLLKDISPSTIFIKE